MWLVFLVLRAIWSVISCCVRLDLVAYIARFLVVHGAMLGETSVVCAKVQYFCNILARVG